MFVYFCNALIGNRRDASPQFTAAFSVEGKVVLEVVFVVSNSRHEWVKNTDAHESPLFAQET